MVTLPRRRSPSGLHHIPGPGGNQAWCPAFDDRADLDSIRDVLFEGEQIYGVYSGSGPEVRMIALTNRRMVILEVKTDADRGDEQERASLTSVPYSKLNSCSFVADPGESVATATMVAVKVGARTIYEIHCVAEEQAREVHDVVMWHLIGK